MSEVQGSPVIITLKERIAFTMSTKSIFESADSNIISKKRSRRLSWPVSHTIWLSDYLSESDLLSGMCALRIYAL
jgi:hypothetical protein